MTRSITKFNLAKWQKYLAFCSVFYTRCSWPSSQCQAQSALHCSERKPITCNNNTVPIEPAACRTDTCSYKTKTGTRLAVMVWDWQVYGYPDSKVHGANMGPIWGRQDPDWLHVGPMNFAIWVGSRVPCVHWLMSHTAHPKWCHFHKKADQFAISLTYLNTMTPVPHLYYTYIFIVAQWLKI